MSDKKYQNIFRHYENTLAKFGPNHQGMDWPDKADLDSRFKVMLELIREPNDGGAYSLLDLGCGVGLLWQFIQEGQQFGNLSYHGMDISEMMIGYARDQFPEVDFQSRDILKSPLAAETYDYIVMNGVLTEKVNLEQEEMIEFATNIISVAFQSCRKGVAFNVMSSHVDWQREDLFHWPVDDLVAFLVKNCSRHIQVRMDYGLYEYTVYVYKSPQRL